MSASDLAAAVAAALAGAWAVAALREGAHGWPAARDWVEAAISPVLRAGSEGYVPSDSERRRLWLIASLALALLVLAVFGSGLHLAIVGAVPLASDRLIAARRGRFRAAVEAGLGPWARALGDAIDAGRSVRAALIGAAAGAPAPLASELGRVGADLETGAPLAEALDRLAARIGSPGLDSVVGALGVAARSGGEVGALLRRFAAANDERVALLADARAATAQARMTGIAVAAMPAAGLLFAELAAPGFSATLLGDSVARGLLALSAAIQIVSFAAIHRISRVNA